MTLPISTQPLDISRLKPNGSHYVLFAFVIPFRVGLPNDIYDVTASVLGHSVVMQVMIQDIQQSLETNPGSFDSQKKLLQTTSARVFIPVRITDTAEITREQLWRLVYDTKFGYYHGALEAVNRLLEIYRFVSGECSVRPILSPMNTNLALLFNHKPPDGPESCFTAISQEILLEGLPIPYITRLPDALIAATRQKLASDFKIPLHEELLLNAHDLIQGGNFRLAIVETETAFEAALIGYVLENYVDDDRKWTKAKNASQHSFTQFLDHYLTQAVFERQATKFNPQTAMYNDWRQNVWQIRGSIVHGREKSVSEDKASIALRTVEECLQYLTHRAPIEVNKYRRCEVS